VWCVSLCVCVCVCVCVYVYGSQGQEHKLEVSKVSIQLVENALIAANNHAKAHLVFSSPSPTPFFFCCLSLLRISSSSYSFLCHIPLPPCSSLSSFLSFFVTKTCAQAPLATL